MTAAIADIIHMAADAATIISGFITAEEALHHRHETHKAAQSHAKHKGSVITPVAQLPVFSPAKSPELAYGIA